MPSQALPIGWECGNIRRFAQMKSGHTPSRSIPANWEDTSIPWFTLADVWQLRDGRQIYLGETASTINELGLANSSAELLGAGTVVLSRTASVGFSGIMSKPMATSQDFWNWVCGPKLIPEYLNYQFKSMGAEFRALNLGSTHQTIYQKDAASLQIAVPPVGVQEGIVEYLDRETTRVDILIEEQEHLIEMLRERRLALISRETGWGAEPSEAWPMMRLSWLFAATGSGTTPANEDITYGEGADVPWVTTGELREAVVLKTARGVGIDVVDRYSALKVHPAGSLLIAMYGATIGRMGLLGVDATSNQACCALVGPTLVLAEFVQYSLLAAKESLLLEAAGGGQPNINQEKIRSFRIPVPPLHEQGQITRALNEQTDKIDQLIAETELFIELSRERRAALITAAVTGQIDVREVA